MDLSSSPSPSLSSSPYKDNNKQIPFAGGLPWLHHHQLDQQEASSSAHPDHQQIYHQRYLPHRHQLIDLSSEPENEATTTTDITNTDQDEHDEALTGATATAAAGQCSSTGGTSTTAVATVEREHMFDKVVTPSDVGKLNRLVIPKQHAEKYFPLHNSSSSSSSSNGEKGLLLSFEDRSGKSWRFRYSYWNSSQSYVMTKGWSRFVKEKKLDAGDIISFQRGMGEASKGRFFIDWRRRQADAPPLPSCRRGILQYSPHDQYPATGIFLPGNSYHHTLNLNFSAHHHQYQQYPLSCNPWQSTSNITGTGAAAVAAGQPILRPPFVQLPAAFSGGQYQVPRMSMIGVVPHHQYAGSSSSHQHHHSLMQGTAASIISRSSASTRDYQHYYQLHHDEQHPGSDKRPEVAVFRLPMGLASSSLVLDYMNVSGGGAAVGDPYGMMQMQLDQPITGGGGGDDDGTEAMVFESVPVVQSGKARSAAPNKQLRLFGVNMDCSSPISQAADHYYDHHHHHSSGISAASSCAPTFPCANDPIISSSCDHRLHGHPPPHPPHYDDHLRYSSGAGSHLQLRLHDGTLGSSTMPGPPCDHHHQGKGESSFMSLDLGI